MSNNDVTDEAADVIAAALSHNAKLQKLYLGGNKLHTTGGAIKTAKGLQSTSALIVFDMRNNGVSDETADDIAAVLSHNTKLQELHLGWNNFHAAGAVKIAKGLQSNTILTVFGMEFNDISDEAAVEIRTILSRNSNLQRLSLYKKTWPFDLVDKDSLSSSSISFSSIPQRAALLTVLVVKKKKLTMKYWLTLQLLCVIKCCSIM